MTLSSFAPLLAIIALLSNQLNAKPVQVELLIDKNYKPYSYLEEGKPRGMYVDLVEAAFALMPDFSVKLTAVDWNEGKKRIQRGDALGLVGVYFHGHDWAYMFPYSRTLGKETVVTICHTKVLEKKRDSWPQDYQGLLVGNIEGYDGWLNNDVRSETNTKYVNFFEVPTIGIALKMVGQGSLDCALFESSAFDYAMSHYDVKNSPGFSTPVVSSEISVNSLYVGYSRKAMLDNTFPFAFEFQQAFDVALFQLQRSGKADLIRSKYQAQTPELE